MRGEDPFIFSNLKSGRGLTYIAEFIIDKSGLDRTTPNKALASL